MQAHSGQSQVFGQQVSVPALDPVTLARPAAQAFADGDTVRAKDSVRSSQASQAGQGGGAGGGGGGRGTFEVLHLRFHAWMELPDPQQERRRGQWEEPPGRSFWEGAGRRVEPKGSPSTNLLCGLRQVLAFCFLSRA